MTKSDRIPTDRQERFNATRLRLSNGMVLSFDMAKQMGYLPADARPEDLS